MSRDYYEGVLLDAVRAKYLDLDEFIEFVNSLGHKVYDIRKVLDRRVLGVILDHLGLRDIINLTKTCKAFNEIRKSKSFDEYWKIRFKRRFPATERFWIPITTDTKIRYTYRGKNKSYRVRWFYIYAFTTCSRKIDGFSVNRKSVATFYNTLNLDIPKKCIEAIKTVKCLSGPIPKSIKEIQRFLIRDLPQPLRLNNRISYNVSEEDRRFLIDATTTFFDNRGVGIPSGFIGKEIVNVRWGEDEAEMLIEGGVAIKRNVMYYGERIIMDYSLLCYIIFKTASSDEDLRKWELASRLSSDFIWSKVDSIFYFLLRIVMDMRGLEII